MSYSQKITIIVPVYKTEKYINRCVDSILNQTYHNFELILVDDGSPDSCGAICDEYALMDHRVKVIHQKNRGVSSARNAGLDNATGEYIAFVDSDDYIEPDMYEILLGLIVETKSDIACISMIHYDLAGTPKAIVEDDKVYTFTREEAIRNMFYDNTTTSGYLWNKLFKSSLFDGVRLNTDIKVREDALIMWDLFYRSECIAFQKKSKYHYIYYPSSAAHSFSPSYITSCEACRIMLEKTQKSLPNIVTCAQYYLIENNFQVIAKMVEFESFDKEIYLQLRKEIKNNLTKEVKRLYSHHRIKKRISYYLMLNSMKMYMFIKKLLKP